MPYDTSFQAVVLAGGQCEHMLPLTSSLVKAMLPVANKPLISYPLKLLADAGVKSVLVVAAGETASCQVQAYLDEERQKMEAGEGPKAQSGLKGQIPQQCEVLRVPEESDTTDAIRLAAPKLTAKTILVVSGDLVTNVSLKSLIMKHTYSNAMATVALAPRRTSPSEETKSGKTPKGVTYVGLDGDGNSTQLVFMSGSKGSIPMLKFPPALLRSHPRIRLHTNYVDTHLYILNRSVLSLLDEQPSVDAPCKGGATATKPPPQQVDFLPYLLTHWVAQSPKRKSGSGGAIERTRSTALGASPPDLDSMDWENERGDLSNASKASSEHPEEGGAGVQSPQCLPRIEVQFICEGSGGAEVEYCTRVNSVESYANLNRDLTAPEVWPKITGRPWSEPRPGSITAGNKVVIQQGSFVGEGTVLGDKTSVKRSVVGKNCKLGVNVKVINSVLMDGVVVGDQCNIQNSILCSEVTLHTNCNLKNCQVEAQYEVMDGYNANEEVLRMK